MLSVAMQSGAMLSVAMLSVATLNVAALIILITFVRTHSREFVNSYQGARCQFLFRNLKIKFSILSNFFLSSILLLTRLGTMTKHF
jgi:hypothetical protein